MQDQNVQEMQVKLDKATSERFVIFRESTNLQIEQLQKPLQGGHAQVGFIRAWSDFISQLKFRPNSV